MLIRISHTIGQNQRDLGELLEREREGEKVKEREKEREQTKRECGFAWEKRWSGEREKQTENEWETRNTHGSSIFSDYSHTRGHSRDIVTHE